MRVFATAADNIKTRAYQSQNSVSDYNPLDLIEAELIAPAIVELRGARAELPDLLTSNALKGSMSLEGYYCREFRSIACTPKEKPRAHAFAEAGPGRTRAI